MTSEKECQDSARAEVISEVLRTRYWSWSFYSPTEHPPRLLDVLLERLPHIEAASWPSRFDFGGVYVNGREAREDHDLPSPCRIEYYEPKFEISQAATVFPEFLPEYVLYRDEHILVAYKPPGLSSMPAKEQRHYSLKASLEKLVGTTIHMPSRLDVSARGLVITSISHAAHGALQRAFESRSVNKIYVCATNCLPPWKDIVIERPIGRDPAHPVLRSIRGAGGQSAQTSFRSLGECYSDGNRFFALMAQPLTGRTHQIRVHAASEGLPLVGDRFYGGAPASSLHLISVALECQHPITGRHCAFRLPSSLLPDWAQSVSTCLGPHPNCDHASPE